MTIDRRHSVGGGIADEAEREASTGTIIVPLADEPPSRTVRETAIALAEATASELLLLKAVVVPEQIPLALADDFLDEPRRQLAEVFETLPETDCPKRDLIYAGRTTKGILASAVEDHGGSVVVAQSAGHEESTYRPLRTRTVESVGASTDCGVVTETEPADEGVVSILVPIADGPHSECALELAQVLATYHEAWLELLHVIPDDADEDRVARGEAFLASQLDRVDDRVSADTWLLEADDIAEAIVEQSAYYDLTVVGAPRKGRLRRFVFGSTTATVERAADNGVLTVRAGGADGSNVRR